MKKYSLINVFILLLPFVLLVTFSCNQEENKRKQLKKECLGLLATDIRKFVKTTLDAGTMGIGSIVMDVSFSEKEQDSLIISPVVGSISRVLDKKSTAELEEIKASPYKRRILIVDAFKEKAPELKASLADSFSVGKTFVEDLVSNISKKMD
jgi:hypothetical protein